MRVAVLGAGYAGLTVARRLERTLPDHVELVVVDDTGEHLLKHEIHRAIRHPGIADDLRIPLADVLDRATIRRARVTDVDPDAGVATLEGAAGEADRNDGAVDDDGTGARDGEYDGDGGDEEGSDAGDADDGGGDGQYEISYDYAAVCLGAETDFHGLPGLEEHATPLSRLDHARAIRERFLDVCGAGGRVVVGGAGLSGVQVAGELAELAEAEGAAGRVRVDLVEQLPAVAPGFPDAFQNAVRDELTARDVRVRTGTSITGATADGVETETGSIDCDQLVWTGGIRGPAALDAARTSVRADLRLGDGTFVLGDAARVVDREGKAVPASAQAAVRAGRVAARNLRRLVEADSDDPDAFGPRLDRLDFEPLGWTVSVGDGAVAQLGPTVLRGRAARAAKAAAGLGHLTTIGRVREALAVVREELG